MIHRNNKCLWIKNTENQNVLHASRNYEDQHRYRHLKETFHNNKTAAQDWRVI